ncbi:MAG: sigma-70 family RNA polymerase sigma factor [Bacteroidota bacterium]|jgi:RNA polymerase sigma-70 factor (ECF subfamily)
MNFFSRNTLSDEAILKGIIGDGILQRTTENKLYEQYFYFIKDATFKHQLSVDEAASLYTDTILAFIENVKNKRFEGKSAIKTYLYQIFSNKCVDFLRKTATNKMSVHEAQPIQDWILAMPDDSKNVLQKLITDNEVNVLQEKIKHLGEKCQQMVLAWGDGFSDNQIAQELGYQTANVAKVSRLRCLDKLRELYRK